MPAPAIAYFLRTELGEPVVAFTIAYLVEEPLTVHVWAAARSG